MCPAFQSLGSGVSVPDLPKCAKWSQCTCTCDRPSKVWEVESVCPTFQSVRSGVSVPVRATDLPKDRRRKILFLGNLFLITTTSLRDMSDRSKTFSLTSKRNEGLGWDFPSDNLSFESGTPAPRASGRTPTRLCAVRATTCDGPPSPRQTVTAGGGGRPVRGPL